jgi:hypothetical protein
LAATLLVAAAAPALANTTSTDSARPRALGAAVLADAQSSPAGMQERSRRSDVDSDETSPDDADGQDQSDDDDSDRGPFADRGSDFVPPDGPDEYRYRPDPDPGEDAYGPPQRYEDGDRDGQSDEDEDDENDDDSGIHQA